MGKNNGWSLIEVVVPPEVKQHLANSVPTESLSEAKIVQHTNPDKPLHQDPTKPAGVPANSATPTKHISPAKPRKGKAKNK